MKISLDEGVTWIEAPEGVRVSYSLETDPRFEQAGPNLLFNFGREGLIVDLYPDMIQPESDETVCIPIDNLANFLSLEGEQQ